MRSSAILALGCYAVAARAQADEAAAAPSATVSVPLPKFTPTTLKAPFFEQFTDGWESRWKSSNAKKADTADEEWQYVGNWAVEEPTVYPGIAGDKGLVLKDKAAHHAISAQFGKPIDNKGKTLVVQYEVKLQSGLECGGAYMKLLQENSALKSDEFSNASPYIIMFGPDKCGSTNKVHFIFRHKNPKTGEYEEKHLETAPPAKITKLSTLYTLVVRPDQTFEILIDGDSIKNGSLLEDFVPSVNPPKQIDDAKDKKPADWVEEEKIADPDATKPDDWDEDAPYEIYDESVEKPDDWLEDEPRTVQDPTAEKPEDWDDEEDGDWIPPYIDNPKCNEVSGCGPWSKPLVKNPEYKGKWTAPYIDNPLFKGIWYPRKIDNPDYFEDKTPANFEPMGAIGFEIWTMSEDILFDNIYIGHSVDDAKKLQAETYDIKRPHEQKAEDASKPAEPPAPKKSPSELVFLDDPVTFIKEKTQLFIEIAKRDPVEAVKFVPEVAGALGVGLLTLVIIIAGALSGGSGPSADQVKAKAQQAKDSATKAKDQASAAVASGAEQVKDEVNKRTTRSSKERIHIEPSIDLTRTGEQDGSIPVVLCGREPGLSAAFVQHMLPEYDGESQDPPFPTPHILLVCQTFSTAQSELPALLRGESVRPSSGLGSNPTSPPSPPSSTPKVPVAIICGGGFSPADVAALRVTPGLERAPVFAANPQKVAARVTAGQGPPGVEEIVARVKEALGKGYEGVGVREW